MKKIMFYDRYGLTDAVLSGRKTMTRRVEKKFYHPLITDISGWRIDNKEKLYITISYSTGLTENIYPAYQIGEEVAIAQSYKTLIEQGYLCRESDGWVSEEFIVSPGYSNKMFVRADLMPHRILITNIKMERLQDISDEDCLREGVILAPFRDFPKIMYLPYDGCKDEEVKYYAKSAFAHLIDKVSRKGTWNLNPWVFVYEFELTKL